MWYRSFLHNLTNTKTRYDEAISQTTSGKKLNYLSDNPSDMSYVLTLRSKLGQIDQYEKNINSAYGFLNTSESALDQVKTLFYSVVSLAEQGASEDNGPDERAAIADRVEAIREEIMNFANTEIMGKYIFAGSATDTPPFEYDAVVPPPGRPYAVNYVGNSDDIDIQADFSVTITTNIPGDQVFTGPIDIFSRLADLIENLNNDDTTGIANDISNMNELINQMSESIGTIGNRTAHLQQIHGLLKNFKTSMQSKMSSLEDADMAEAVSNLAREEVGLQATLQSGSRIQRFSLMNYLG
jgi:flagellar hook-associated protein 3 FlgL